MSVPVQGKPAATKATSWPQAATAVERLKEIKENRLSFIEEMRNNWAGWLFSFGFHGGILALGLLMVAATPAVVKEFVLDTAYNADVTKMTDVPLEESDDFDSTIDADIDGPDSVISDAKNDMPNAGYNDLAPGQPEYLTVGGGGLSGPFGAGGGHGGDHLAGRGFRGHIQKLRQTGLDIVFCFDSTGSMGGIILETKTRIRQLMSVVQYLVPECRLGLVTYRDSKMYKPIEYEYTTKSKPLTQDIKSLEAFLRGTEAYGGGDIPEAIYEGLEAAMNLNWNQGTTKIIIVFGDAPPHPENDGLNKVYALIEQWKKKYPGAVISCIDCGGNSGAKVMDEFKMMAKAGGGDAMLLSNQKGLIRQLAIYIFGSKYETEVDKIYNTVLKGPANVDIIDDSK